MKVLSFYLPQFHTIPENDLWWGKNFTEWTAVKAAVPLFDYHMQPHVPQEKNYYNLLDKHVVTRQAEWMREYGIDGQCIYHYYFADGKKILEKPAENLLKWIDIDMPFCFCWANESWIRSWSFYKGVKGNPWFDIYDKNKDSNKDGILLKQDYGTEQDWIEHFYYLLPFFRDERYIRQEGKPIFVIYKPLDIGCLENMINCWRNLAYKEGLKGIYIIGAYSRIKGCMDNILTIEPQDTINRFYSEFTMADKGVWRVCDYEEIWKWIIYKSAEQGACISGFSGYDDSPRRGRNGTVVCNQDPDIFKKYFLKLLYKADYYDSPFLFVNAWNEWGEGMYLEPNEVFGMEMLEALRQAKKEFSFSMCKLDDERWRKTADRELADEKKRVVRYCDYWIVLDQLLSIEEQGFDFSSFLQRKGYRSIAIYGIGMIGKHFLKLCEKSDLNVMYLIDQRKLNSRYKIFNPEDDLPLVDLIICTVESEYESIKNKLLNKVMCEVVSLKKLLEECTL